MHWFLSWYAMDVEKMKFIARYILKYYISWLHNFNRLKLKRNLLTRMEHESRPNCEDCGLCCKHCIAYREEKGHCKIWEQSDGGRITRCREWPITPWQLRLNPQLKDVCRFYWEK